MVQCGLKNKCVEVTTSFSMTSKFCEDPMIWDIADCPTDDVVESIYSNETLGKADNDGGFVESSFVDKGEWACETPIPGQVCAYEENFREVFDGNGNLKGQQFQVGDGDWDVNDEYGAFEGDEFGFYIDDIYGDEFDDQCWEMPELCGDIDVGGDFGGDDFGFAQVNVTGLPGGDFDFVILRKGALPVPLGGDYADEIGFGWKFGDDSQVDFWGAPSEVADAVVFKITFDEETWEPTYAPLSGANVVQQ